MKRIAVIPARGGSKRIPHKNIKPFLGSPIIVYSIRAALESKQFDDVVVSTDDTRIAEIALDAGANVPFYRSAGNSGDNAPSGNAVYEVLEKYRQLAKTFDTVACLYPTAPFMTGEKIRDAVVLFDSTGCAALCAMVKFSFPPQRGFLVEDSRAAPWFPEKIAMRSQELRDVYHDAGQLFIIHYEEFMKSRRMFSSDLMPFIVSELESQDIDTETDWTLAELKYKWMTEHHRYETMGDMPE